MSKKQYTQEEIKNMSYWQLWELRRQSGILYFIVTIGLYTFLIYCFFKIMFVLAKSSTLEFKVDWWAIILCLLAGPIYYYLHELYYKYFYLKKQTK